MPTPDKVRELTPKAARTRQALIVSARKLTGEHGVDAVSVMAVCDDAGVGRTSFYNYFDDVNALLSTVAARAGGDVKQAFDTLHEGTPRGMERLTRCLTMILELAVKDPEMVLLITALARNGGEIAEMLQAEILAELDGARRGDALVPDIQLARFLSLAVLTLARELAEGKIEGSEIATLITLLLRTAQSE